VQPSLQWKSHDYYTKWVCVCSLRYPACNASYCYLWPAPLYNIFPHYLIKARLKKIAEYKMCVLIFSTTFVWHISHSTKKWASYDFKKKYIVLHLKYPFSDFNETCEYSRQIFEKYTNIKLHKNLSSGSLVVACGRTDMTELIVASQNFANAPKNTFWNGDRTFCNNI
jgi:hypothetical protein